MSASETPLENRNHLSEAEERLIRNAAESLRRGPAHKLPIIGIVPTYRNDDKALLLPYRYINAIAKAGGSPVILPFTQDVSIYETLLPTMDGFLLSGGEDIDPVRYGEEIIYGKQQEVFPDREEVEYLIISFARQYDIPLLGICRGMQMINVAFGGKLYQDVDGQYLGIDADKPTHWQQGDYHTPAHSVFVEGGTKLGEILGSGEVQVNSMHHQGIREIGEGLRVSARTDDGLVEGIEATDLSFLLGTQWHPEFFADSGTMGPLFEALVAEAGHTRCSTRNCGSCVRILREECGGCFPLIRFASEEETTV